MARFANLGPCNRKHDEFLRHQFLKESPADQYPTQMQFLRYLERLVADADVRINKGRGRLNRTLRPNLSDPEARQREEAAHEISEKISALLKQAEVHANEGRVDEVLELMNHVERHLEEKSQLENMNLPPENPQARNQEKQMLLCDVCGAFLVQNDAEQRVTSHLQGKQHLGYIQIRKTIQELKAIQPPSATASSSAAVSGVRSESRHRSQESDGYRDDRYSSRRSSHDRGSRGRRDDDRYRSNSRDNRRY
eukprot:TRINITY_DN17272_c0_g1_i3.p1 TRINITY_DN17272_c0_g1~~TRINITY_DN17272_c0_g1_i3.p1  ORF type:complete len:251 (+),score=60.54 TRINITY_DN17272_c0_g1_i3:126-878(+)